MQLIQALPSDQAVRDALIAEIKTGWQFMKERERLEELKAEKQAAEMRSHKSVNGLGKCVAVIPADEWHLLNKRYGHAEVHSKEFLRYFNKKFPHLSPNRI